MTSYFMYKINLSVRMATEAYLALYLSNRRLGQIRESGGGGDGKNII